VLREGGSHPGWPEGRLVPAHIEGIEDFVLFWQTLPWDHVPGALLVEEAGGTVRRPGGEQYLPASGGFGLLAATDTNTWNIADRLLE
jgi:fructose-1,6-bisphosphatase/inositol monophosphatase family enzyme